MVLRTKGIVSHWFFSRNIIIVNSKFYFYYYNNIRTESFFVFCRLHKRHNAIILINVYLLWWMVQFVLKTKTLNMECYVRTAKNSVRLVYVIKILLFLPVSPPTRKTHIGHQIFGDWYLDASSHRQEALLEGNEPADLAYIICGSVRNNYIPYVRHIVWYMKLGPGIKITLGPLDRRFDSLITSSQSPPFSVILVRLDFSIKHAPSPLVN